MPLISLRRAADGTVEAAGDFHVEAGHQVPGPGADPEGIYLRWTWTGGRLVLERDRYGLFPLFASCSRDRCVVSTDLARVLEHGVPRDLDDDAMSVFVRLGFFIGCDTPFAAIRAVPPGPGLECDASGFRLSCPAVPHAAPSGLSRTAAIDALNAAVDAAIARRWPRGAYQLPLTGGRDSRHILLALHAAGCPPDACVTVAHFPPRGNDDVAIASDLCRRLGISHVVLPQPRDRVCLERRKNRRTHFCADEHAQFVVLADYLGEETAETYDGIAGDVLSQSSHLTPEIVDRFERGDEDGVAASLLDGSGTSVSESGLDALLAPEVRRRWSRDRAVARLRTEIRRHFDAPNPVASFFFWNRTRREIALSPYGLMRDVIVYAPFLDREVYDLLASLPARSLLDRRLHTDAIARAYPQMDDVLYEQKRRVTIGRGVGRRLARSLVLPVARGGGLLRPSTLLAAILATAVDGRSQRLWHLPQAVYLAQLSALAEHGR